MFKERERRYVRNSRLTLDATWPPCSSPRRHSHARENRESRGGRTQPTCRARATSNQAFVDVIIARKRAPSHRVFVAQVFGRNMCGKRRRRHRFSAFWLRSSVVSGCSYYCFFLHFYLHFVDKSGIIQLPRVSSFVWYIFGQDSSSILENIWNFHFSLYCCVIAIWFIHQICSYFFSLCHRFIVKIRMAFLQGVLVYFQLQVHRLLKALTWIIILNRHVFQSRIKLLWLSKVARVLLIFHLGILMYLLRV